MLILSWNVAGLSTTVQRIHEQYGSKSTTASTPSTSAKSSLLASFFQQRHGADIVCLQEHKIPVSTLRDRAEPHQIAASSSNDDYESFWSCCRDPTSKGRNGVVTFVPTGCTVRADAEPFKDPTLDAQGRCIRTDHCLLVEKTDGANARNNKTVPFCIFNVYVPCGAPSHHKMKFLNALRRAMIQQRQQGKAVILVGDLNITANKLDVFWKDRVVDVNEILAQNDSKSSEHTHFPQWKRDIRNHWSKIAAVMNTKQVVATQTTNSRTNATYNKFRLAVTVASDCHSDSERRILLGNHQLTPDHCLYGYELAARSFVDEESGTVVVMRQENVVSVAVLTELMHKIAAIPWSEAVQREMALTVADVDHCNPARQWLNREILLQDGMVDAFRHFYPSAQARFTCWNQNKNGRYINDGCRLDYTLIDSSLLQFLQQGENNVTSPRCPMTTITTRESDKESADSSLDPHSEEAALAACTANGRFEPASFEGGGMLEASRDALDTQFGPRHTGHIYTPPTFSDHIAVSVLFGSDNRRMGSDSTTTHSDLAFLQRELALQNDAATRKAQPHKQQRSLISFFSATSCSVDDAVKTSATTSIVAKRLTGKPRKIPANSVLHHFAKKKIKKAG